MTIGELLTAFPWVAPVEVFTPCGADEKGEPQFESAWRRIIFQNSREATAEIAAKEIASAAVMKTTWENTGEIGCLMIFTK